MPSIEKAAITAGLSIMDEQQKILDATKRIRSIPMPREAELAVIEELLTITRSIRGMTTALDKLQQSWS